VPATGPGPGAAAKQAAGFAAALEFDSGIPGLAIDMAAACAIGPGVHTAHAAVGVHIPGLAQLRIAHMADVQRRAQQGLGLGAALLAFPVRLQHQAFVALGTAAAREQAGAFFGGLILRQSVGQTFLVRKGRVAAVFASGVDVLVERALVHIAVEAASFLPAQVGLGAQAPAFVHLVAAHPVEHERMLARGVGCGVDALEILRELTTFLQAVALQFVVGPSHAQLAAGAAITPPKLAKELAHIAGRLLAPAAVVEQVDHAVAVQTLIARKAVFEQQGAALVAAQLEFEAGARRAPAVFGLQGQPPAQGIEAKQRVGAGHQRERLQGRTRDQVPADHVAKRLVHAHAVKVNRQALWRAQEWRGGEAAVLHISLEGVALHVLHQHAAQVPTQQFAHILRGQIIECAQMLHWGGELGECEVKAWQRPRGLHKNSADRLRIA